MASQQQPADAQIAADRDARYGHLTEVVPSPDKSDKEYSANFFANPSATPTDAGIRAGDHIIEATNSPIDLTPSVKPSEPLPPSSVKTTTEAGDHIIESQLEPLDISPVVPPTSYPADPQPKTEDERNAHAGRVTEHYDNKAQQVVAAAQPYVEQARSTVAGVAAQAQPYVEQAKAAAAPYVERARSVAAPYVESAKSTAAPYVESARSTAVNVQQSAAATATSAQQQAASVAQQAQVVAAQAQQKVGEVTAQARETAAPYIEKAGPYIETVKTTAAQAAHVVAEQVQKVTSIPAVHESLESARSLTNQAYDSAAHNPIVTKTIQTVEPYVKAAAHVVEPYVKAAQEALAGHGTAASGVSSHAGEGHVATAVEKKEPALVPTSTVI